MSMVFGPEVRRSVGVNSGRILRISVPENKKSNKL